ncbi:MAG TPA: hypothetical protein VGU69_11260 [Rhizomicrobium sp.]|nr:hypothetical protein [Rhizomicrobium sp.]
MSDETDDLIDRALAALPPPAISPALRTRVLDDFTRESGRNPGAWLRRQLDSIWPGVPLWQPVAALAVSLAIGLGIGVFAPLPGEDDGASALSLDAPAFISVREG